MKRRPHWKMQLTIPKRRLFRWMIKAILLYLTARQGWSRLVTSSRVVGDPFIADTRFVSGRKLKCLDIGSVGSLFNDAKTRTPSSVTFMNEDGLEEKVIPLDSYYEDNDDSLFFGGPHGVSLS